MESNQVKDWVVSVDWLLNDDFLLFLTEETCRALSASRLAALKIDSSLESALISTINKVELYPRLDRFPLKTMFKWGEEVFSAESVCQKLKVPITGTRFGLFSLGSGPGRWLADEKICYRHVDLIHEPFYPVLYSTEHFMTDIWRKDGFGKLKTEEYERIRDRELQSAKNADVTLAFGEVLAKAVSRLYGVSAKPVPPPVAENIFYPKNEPEEYYVCAVEPEPGRGLEVVVDAFRYIKNKIVFLSYRPFPEFLLKKMRYNAKVVRISVPAEKAEAISKAKAVICPGEYRHAQSGYEALAMGVPVIAHKNSSVAAEITEETGLSYDAGNTDALLHGLFQFEKQRFYRDKILEAGRRFNRETYHAAIKEAISGKEVSGDST